MWFVYCDGATLLLAMSLNAHVTVTWLFFPALKKEAANNQEKSLKQAALGLLLNQRSLESEIDTGHPSPHVCYRHFYSHADQQISLQPKLPMSTGRHCRKLLWLKSWVLSIVCYIYPICYWIISHVWWQRPRVVIVMSMRELCSILRITLSYRHSSGLDNKDKHLCQWVSDKICSCMYKLAMSTNVTFKPLREVEEDLYNSYVIKPQGGLDHDVCGRVRKIAIDSKQCKTTLLLFQLRATK